MSLAFARNQSGTGKVACKSPDPNGEREPGEPRLGVGNWIGGQLWILIFLIKGAEHQKVETQKEDREKTSNLKNKEGSCSDQSVFSKFLCKTSVE